MTDIITMIANLALALSFIVGLIFGIAQVRTSARDRRERLTLQARANQVVAKSVIMLGKK